MDDHTLGGSPPVDPTFERLKAWRDREVLESRLQLGEIKDTYLRAVARSGQRRAAEIAAMLPAALRKYAPDLERLVTTSSGPATPTLPAELDDMPVSGSQHTAAPSSNPTSPVPSGHSPAPPATSPSPTSVPPSSAPSAAEVPVSVPPPEPVPPRPEHPPEPEGFGLDRPGPRRAADLNAAPTGVQPPDLAAGFAPYEFGSDLDAAGFAGEAVPSSVVLRSLTGADGVRLAWDQPSGLAGATAYRVVSSDEHRPYSPDRADLVGVVLGDAERGTLDTRPFTAAIRYYQVWCNTGPTLALARRGQPRLIAEKAVVSRVVDVELREDEGRVIGQWSVWYGIDRVHIYRTPVERARPGQPDPQYRILAGDPNLGGFVDNDAERGRRYLYQFCTEAEVDGVPQLSGAVTVEVGVSAVVDPIEDLEVSQHGDDDDWQFDLLWSPQPAGRVFVYRTENRPLAGAEHGSHPESALPQMNLADADRLAHPISPQPDGRVGMRNVPWPRRWDRAYFTPVVVLDGIARVGRTVPAVRVRPVHDPVIVERCDQQVLKFGWPPGAATVLAEILQGGDVTGTVECSTDLYNQLGGVQFGRPLPNRGATVRITGVSFVGGERRESVPVEVGYPGLMRIRYVLELRRTLLLKPDRVLVRLYSESDIGNCPPLVLVHHPTRLPLHPGDGQQLEVTEDIEEVTRPVLRFRPDGIGTRPSEVAWKASVRGRTGYVRLFADLPPERTSLVAILDPPVDALRLG
ncbi:hypothetical protein [Microlunatus sp. GCM10028923]|uniref:hypothetical protein n=1 Tax=Microlunatus sp. GCM10028923 TaxID=3273400 RepID=UPI0036202B4C